MTVAPQFATDSVPQPGHGRARRVASPIAASLRKLHARHRDDMTGEIASYIPELAIADPRWFGIAIATVDGIVHEVGDTRVPFTIQSISKALTYGLAIDRLGEAAVRERIGVEPTGEAFNAITLTPGAGRPFNPMVNAGAIAATGLLTATAGDSDPFTVLLDGFARFAARPLSVDERVDRSERETGHRNRAIGHLLRASGVIDGDTEAVVERYFRQCSVEVDARDLAVMAATLANGGRNPISDERAISPRAAQAVLSVMATCGMYDGAGEWMVSIGLPAKSGVAGGLIAVLPGQLGIGIFSPPLDRHGNSVRATRVCRDLSMELGLNVVARAPDATSPVRRRYTIAELGSKRRRNADACATLAVLGRRSIVVELQGAMGVLAVERIASSIDIDASPDHVVLDFGRVAALEQMAAPLIARLVGEIRDAGAEVSVSGHRRHASGFDLIDLELAAGGAPRLARFDDLDRAVEQVEQRLLASDGGPGTTAVEGVDLADHRLLAGLDPQQVRRVRDLLEHRRYAAGQRVVRAGDAATDLYLVTSGRLSVTVDLDGTTSRRLSTLGPGMMFGEAALLGRGQRSANVDADEDVECHVISDQQVARLELEEPAIAARILRNLATIVLETAQRLTREIAVLAG